MKTISLNNNRYFFLIVYYYFHISWVYFLKKKYEVFETFIELKGMVEFEWMFY